MWTTAEVLRLLGTVPLALLFFLLVRDNRTDRSAQASIFFIAASLSHTFHPMLPAGSLVWLPLFLMGTLVAGSFWLLAKVHFDDDFRLGSAHVALLAGSVLASWACAPGTSPLLRLLPKIVGLAFAVHALLTVYVGTRSDLVVSRLRLRYVVLWSIGTYIFSKLILDAFVEGSPAQAPAEQMADLVRGLLAFGLVTASIRVRPGLLRPPRVDPEAPVLDPRLAEALHRLVEVDLVFREEGLTIGGLAERLGAHEYKVRQLINDQLGFKNFNAFLNHYRVRDAQRLLADPEARHRNVAEVAYAVGYRSLGPFNKAFKDTTGQTPTEFRSARLA